jgi:hypothetical protein
MDVFLFPEYIDKGYSKQLMETIINAEELKYCKTWMLKTFDAHGLCKQFGFEELINPDIVMEHLLKK